MSSGSSPDAPNQPKRPRLVIPGATPPPQAPEPIPAPPAVAQPVPEQPAPPPETVRDASPPAPAPAPAPAFKLTAAAAPPSAPGLGRPGAAGGVRPGLGSTAATPGRPTVAAKPGLPKAQKTGLSNSAKITIAFVLGVIVVIGAVGLIQRSSRNAEIGEYNELVKRAAADGVTELTVNGHQLEILLSAASDVSANDKRQTVYKALAIAKATDGTDVDAVIARHVTEQPMQPDVRKDLIDLVIRRRANPASVPILLKFAHSTSEVAAAAAAMTACRAIATEAQFVDFLDVIRYTSQPSVRTAAEGTAAEILQKAENREEMASRLASAYEGTINDDIRYSLLRLLAQAGGTRAEGIVKAALQSSETKDQVAAVIALGVWVDDSMFETLIEFLEGLKDEQMRPRAFESAYRFLTAETRQLDSETSEEYWKLLARNAKIRSEQEKVIRGLAAKETDDWAIAVIEYFVDEGDDDHVIDLAEKALDRIRARLKLRGDED
jgi:hypothetical protein